MPVCSPPLSGSENADLSVDTSAVLISAWRYNRKLWMACVKRAAYPFELEQSRETQMKGHATWQTVAYRTTLCQSVPRML